MIPPPGLLCHPLSALLREHAAGNPQVVYVQYFSDLRDSAAAPLLSAVKANRRGSLELWTPLLHALGVCRGAVSPSDGKGAADGGCGGERLFPWVIPALGVARRP